MSTTTIFVVVVLILVGVGEILTRGCYNNIYCDWCCYISCLCGIPCCACEDPPDSTDDKYKHIIVIANTNDKNTTKNTSPSEPKSKNGNTDKPASQSEPDPKKNKKRIPDENKKQRKRIPDENKNKK